MSEHAYYRMRTPNKTGVTVRQSGREIRLSVGQSQRLRCSEDSALALWRLLGASLGITPDSIPDWARTEPEVSDQ